MRGAILFLHLPLFASACCGGELPAVVLSEIHYHPPGDAGLLEEFIELHNRTDVEVDLHGWEFTRGVTFRFDRARGPARLAPEGFLVVAKTPLGVARLAGIPVEEIAGPYAGKLANSGERLTLVDARGDVVETVAYADDGAWPARADGLGSSLQRVTSEAPADLAENWAVDFAEAAGPPAPRSGVAPVEPGEPPVSARGSEITPGRPSSVALPALPPAVALVERLPLEPRSGDAVTIRARVEGDDIERVELTYDAGAGERSILLADDGRGPDVTAADGIYSGEIPPAPDQTVVRFRITATNRRGGVSHLPRRGNPSPYAGYYVLDRPPRGNEDLDVFHILWNGTPSCARGVWLRGATLVHRGTAYLDVGLKYRGMTSCGLPKSGLKVDFNRGDLIRGQKQLNFLAGWQDRSLLREKLAWDLFRDLGHPHFEAHMAAVYTNGNRMHGLFVTLEEPGKEFLRRSGIDTESTLWSCHSSFLGPGSGGRRLFRVRASSEEEASEAALLELEAGLHALTGKEHIEYVLGHIDVEALIEYQTVKCLISDQDGYTKNWFLCQSAAETGGNPAWRWRVLPWDLDLSFGQFSLYEEAVHTGEHPLAGTADYPRRGSHGLRWSGLIEAVFGRRSVDYFTKALYGRIWSALEEKFNPHLLGEKIDRLDANTIAAARADLERWPRWGIEPDRPEGHRRRLRAYVAARYAYLRSFLLSENPTTASHVEPWGDLARPRVAEGEPPPRAVLYRAFRYTPAPRMKITEIHYNPADDEGLEFIEVRSLEGAAVDVSGWNVPAVGFVFPPGSEVPGGATWVLARDPRRLMARHPALEKGLVFGPYPGRLSNAGEDLRLRDRGRDRGRECFPETIDVVKYRDRAPWPALADGSGSSLELIDAALDNDLPSSWRASSARGGTPGR